MRSATYLLLISSIVAGAASPSYAVIGQLVRKTITSAGKRSTTVARQGSEETVKRVAPRGLSTASGATTRQSVRRHAKTLMTSGTRSVIKTGSAASKRVIDTLGIEGARALKKLSPAARDKLAAMSGALAKSPHRAGWLDAIAKHGDRATNWLWKHKGGVAVGTTATAILVKPDKFIETTGLVAEAAVESTTRHVIAPVVKPASMHLATSLITAIAASVGVVALWGAGGMTGLAALSGLTKWTWQKIRAK